MFKIVSLFILGVGLSIFSVFNLKKSMDKTENIGYIKFLEGNRLVEENKIKEAIEEYKVALDNNGDINIKKNYELALKSLENQQQQQNSSENNDKSENQEENSNNQDKNDQSNNNSDNNKNSEDSKDSESSKNSQEEKADSSEKESQSSTGEQQPQNNNQEGQSEKEQQKADELKSIMQRLESNEKKAFKNNERVLNKSENKDSENRW